MIEWLLLFLLGLIVASWNSTIGPTGGALIAGTSIIVPPPGSLLLQGVAALFSNGFRSWKMRKYLQREILYPFLLGSLLAVVPSYLLFREINTDIWMIILGSYCVASGMLSFYKKSLGLPLFPAGLLSGLASFLTGTGSLVAAPSIRKYTKDKYSLISNEALVVFMQGLAKTFLLLAIFALPANFFFLLSALLLSMLLGNIFGLHALSKIPDRLQGRIQVLSVSILGLAVLIQGLV